MSFSAATYALSKKYTDDKVIHVSADVIDEAVSQAKKYTDEVATKIEWHTVIVSTLPAIEDADIHTIYFVAATTQPENDGYFEYMSVNGRWEVIGRTVVDLSNYYTKQEVEDYVQSQAYELLPATDKTLGGVMIDEGSIAYDSNGKISINTINENEIRALF